MEYLPLIEALKKYKDIFGCLVCEPAVMANHHHADQEDSCHKAGHTLALLSWIGLATKHREAIESVVDTGKYFDHSLGHTRLIRHPLTEYTTSRDQVIPFLIGFSSFNPCSISTINNLIRWLEVCSVDKDKWKKWEWVIRLFYHTPNGDIFQTDHAATVIRCKFSITKLDRWKILLGDFWCLMGSFFYVLKGFSPHYVNHTLVVEFAGRKRTTAFSYFNLKFWRRYGQPQRVYDEYFHRPNNPPIGEIYKLVREGDLIV